MDDYHPKDIDQATFDPTDVDGIKAPFLLLSCGPPGSGKTHNLSAYIHTLVKIEIFENCISSPLHITTIMDILIILWWRKKFVKI